MIRALLYIILFSLFALSCTKQKVDRNLLMQKSLKEKEDQYYKIQYNNCSEKLYEEINLEVDSIMFFLVQKMKGQNDIMPQRPSRPARLVDTISLEEKPIELEN